MGRILQTGFYAPPANELAGCRHKSLFGILLFDIFKLKILTGQFIARSFQSENQDVPSGRITSFQ